MLCDLVVPADYGCLALVDTEAYDGFVSENWELEELKQRIGAQAGLERIVAWGCVSGNWIVRLSFESVPLPAVHEFTGVVRSPGRLLLTTYESLTMAAQFSDVSLPEPHEKDNLVEIPEGRYSVKVSQTFSHADAESSEVFEQTIAAFRGSVQPLRSQRRRMSSRNLGFRIEVSVAVLSATELPYFGPTLLLRRSPHNHSLLWARKPASRTCTPVSFGRYAAESEIN